MPAGAYGDGVRVIPWSGTIGALGRIGDPPATGTDLRAYAEPTATGDLLRAYAANLRWRKATGGVTVSGITITTSDDDQAKIAQVKQAFDLGTISSVSFKAASGFVTADAAMIASLYGAVVAHVQACFAAEKAANDAIMAGAAQAWADVDAFFASIV